MSDKLKQTDLPGLLPTTAILPELLMATQVLPSQVANDAAKADGVNGKALKSKNQQRRAKLKAKKAEQKAKAVVRRVHPPHFPVETLTLLVLRAGRRAS